MELVISINKLIAPKEHKEFKRWYKAACSSCSLSADEAFESLGYKVPKAKRDVRKYPPTENKE